MTTPSLPDLSQVTGVLLPDGWHVVADGSLTAMVNPLWPVQQGVPVDLGPFAGFTDDQGIQFAFRYEAAAAFKWAAPPP